MVEATAWRFRTGAPWRDLPERFGNWNTIYKTFARWSKVGVWARVLEQVQAIAHQGGDVELSTVTAPFYPAGSLPAASSDGVHPHKEAPVSGAGLSACRRTLLSGFACEPGRLPAAGSEWEFAELRSAGAFAVNIWLRTDAYL